MLRKKSLDQLDVKGKRVLVRCDFNVPLDDGVIRNDYRIRRTVPTIQDLSSWGAIVLTCSHLGRPGGEPNDEDSLEPVAKRLAELLDKPVRFVSGAVGAPVAEALEEAEPGSVLLLENLRFYPGEKVNDLEFARELASCADLFVQDAYGVCHREHASVVGVPQFLPSAAGRLLTAELEALGRLAEGPDKPYMALLGGAKVSTKIKLIRQLFDKLDGLLIGGAMAYPFLAAKGIEVGSSKLEADATGMARRLLSEADERGVRVLLPSDHRHVASLEDDEAEVEESIPAGRMGVDIGPVSEAAFTERLSDARTVFWNGPVGVVEKGFGGGTEVLARALAESPADVVVGGGDTADCVFRFGLEDGYRHLSTGGGATLEFLGGDSLPGVDALPDAE